MVELAGLNATLRAEIDRFLFYAAKGTGSGKRMLTPQPSFLAMLRTLAAALCRDL